MSYRDQVAADRRRDMLIILADHGGSASEIVLEQGLAMMGSRIGLERSVVRAHMRDLEQVGCITLDFYRDRIMVAQITERGEKVRRGWISVDGVTQPEPGA